MGTKLVPTQFGLDLREIIAYLAALPPPPAMHGASAWIKNGSDTGKGIRLKMFRNKLLSIYVERLYQKIQYSFFLFLRWDLCHRVGFVFLREQNLCTKPVRERELFMCKMTYCVCLCVCILLYYNVCVYVWNTWLQTYLLDCRIISEQLMTLLVLYREETHSPLCNLSFTAFKTNTLIFVPPSAAIL